jgi:hypothetical protein
MLRFISKSETTLTAGAERLKSSDGQLAYLQQSLN